MGTKAHRKGSHGSSDRARFASAPQPCAPDSTAARDANGTAADVTACAGRRRGPSIFNIFEQIPGARHINPSGTGLGLAIVKKIIKCHGGRVWVTSQLGCGSTFYCMLPKLLISHFTHTTVIA